jgi:hypothetical protein
MHQPSDDGTEATAPQAVGSERRGGRGLIAGVVACLVLAAGAGVGGYFVGKSGGEDLDAARAAGAAEGREQGSAKGAEEGYAEGFKEGRREGYSATFATAYRKAYAKEFEQAGLEAPEQISVPKGE